jgi:hypothetical protein
LEAHNPEVYTYIHPKRRDKNSIRYFAGRLITVNLKGAKQEVDLELWKNNEG